MLRIAVHDSNGRISSTRETIWLGNRPVAQVRNSYSSGIVTSTDVYYILSDHLNTPRKITDNTGTVLWSWNSDAFGTIKPQPDVDGDGDGKKFEFNLRFPGQYFDSESGEHYNYFRDYEPGTGRYLESDPIGLLGGVNTFGYVGVNPIRFSDKLGLKYQVSCEGGYTFINLSRDPMFSSGITACSKWEVKWVPDNSKCFSECWLIGAKCGESARRWKAVADGSWVVLSNIPSSRLAVGLSALFQGGAPGGADIIDYYYRNGVGNCDVIENNCRQKCSDCEPENGPMRTKWNPK